MGGLIGALYVITTVVASPRIGIATFMTLIIGGQLLMSLILDNYGWLGAAVKAINVSRVAGMALVVIGILLIKR
jgi:transporter family-2 protein